MKPTIAFLLLVFASVAQAAQAGISLVFTWDNLGAPTEYRIYREGPPPAGSTVPSRVLVKSVTGSPAPKTAEVTGLTPGAYTFLVAAVYPPLEAGQAPVEAFSPRASATIPVLTSPENIVVKIQFTVTAP